MADHLLTARGQDPPLEPIGKNWVSRFINTRPELQTKWNRPLHLQRALCEDLDTIRTWYRRVEETRQEYGILDDDTYNFDKTGFAIGIAGTSKIVTSSERVGRAVTIQPGNRERVTTGECINAYRWAIPPFIIFPGKVHLDVWYRDLPPSWVLAASENGWTTDVPGTEWLKHFNRYTESRTLGRWRLLILGGHSSHATPEFDVYCTENKIVVLYMPSHTSHLLQPLDVGCFSPLKAVYRRHIQELARQHVFHIDKVDFL